MTPAATIEGRMLCASALTYSIPFVYPPTGSIPQTAPYYLGAGYSTPPLMIGSDENDSEAACTVGMNQDGIVLAFRGTVYDSIMDWINDLLVEPVVQAGIVGKVHDGFNDAVNAILSQVVAAIKDLQAANPNALLYITGHSKGAGMGPIAAYTLSNNGINATAVYLFAPPLSGDSAYASSYNNLFPNTFLYENYQDIVAILPPTVAVAAELDYYLIKAGTTESELLAAAITALLLFGYTAVGTENNSNYIEEPVNGVYNIVQINDFVRLEQVAAIGSALVTALVKNNISVFMNAHSRACGYGYMSAICPNVCP